MPRQLQIDFISDVACPWCAIALRNLEEALRRTTDVVQAQIQFHPFELNPDMRAEGENIDELLGSRYGGPDRMAAMREVVRERATAAGFAYNQSATSRIYNTFDAHRLLHWAGTQGLQRELKNALFKAYFTDNANVSDHAVLVKTAASVGLDAQEASAVLTTGCYADDVRAAEQLWQSNDIHAVPAVVIDGEWVISGGQPPEAFEQALRQLAAEES